MENLTKQKIKKIKQKYSHFGAYEVNFTKSIDLSVTKKQAKKATPVYYIHIHISTLMVSWNLASISITKLRDCMPVGDKIKENEF